jgi:hypothetical protein
MLTKLCIYTMKSSADLRELLAAGGRGSFTDGRKWTTAKRLLDAAQTTGHRVPILFAIPEVPASLFAWAVLEAILLGEETTYTFSGLQRFAPCPSKTTLLKDSDEEPLEDGNAVGYAICRTPAYLATPQNDEPARPETARQPEASPDTQSNPAPSETPPVIEPPSAGNSGHSKSSLFKTTSQRVKRHANLVTGIIAAVGLCVPVISLRGVHRILAVALLLTTAVTLYAALKQLSVRQWVIHLAIVLTLPLGLLAYHHWFAEDLVLETFYPDRGKGFAEIKGQTGVLVQDKGAPAPLLVLNIGLRNTAVKPLYLQTLSFIVTDFQPDLARLSAGTPVSYSVTIVFDRTPTKDQINDLETRWDLKHANQADNLVVFESRHGIPDSVLAQLRGSPGVKSVLQTKFGQGQSVVNFVERRLMGDLAKIGDRATAPLDIDLKTDDIAGVRAQLAFSAPGVYTLRGEIDYGRKKLHLPERRVVVTR